MATARTARWGLTLPLAGMALPAHREIVERLEQLGYTDADAILRNAALIGFPLNFVIAWMYGFWSSKKTIIALTALTAAALFGFVIAGNAIVNNRPLLYLLLVVPIWGISSVVAVLSV